MSYKISVDIETLPKLPNALGQFGKWARYNEQKKWKSLIYRHFIGQTPKDPLKKAMVTITRFSARQPDPDNNYASLKPVLDGLVVNGILADDSGDHIDLLAKWENGPAKISIEITEGT